MASVNTNYGAMVALQQLNQTNSALETTQSRINTGLKVSSAKDNGAVFAIAQGMRSDVAGYGVVKDSRGQRYNAAAQRQVLVLNCNCRRTVRISQSFDASR